jgi:hypothetical protein
MSDAIQKQLEDLKQRVADLEAAEIKLRIQSVGPRGSQGTPGRIGERGETGRTGNPGPAGKDGRDGRDGVDGRTPDKDALESIIVTLLHEYHLLDENALPYAGPYAKSKQAA